MLLSLTAVSASENATILTGEADIHVDDNVGNDLNDGSTNLPVKSIERAVSISENDSTIYLMTEHILVIKTPESQSRRH